MTPMDVSTTDALRAAAGLIVLGLAAYAWLIEPSNIQVTEREIEIPRLPDSLDGLTICHLSDLHLRGFRHLERRLVDKLQGREVDLCLITGDFISGARGIKHVGRVLSGLKARYGTYGVYGNAEHRFLRSDLPIAEILAAQGVRMLINQHDLLTINGCEVLIAGVDDPFTARDDPDGALAGTGTAVLRILLAHSPDVVKDLREEIPDLILSGHTHGGQVRLPLAGAIWLHCRHSGLNICHGYYGPEQLSRAAGRDLSPARMYLPRGIGGRVRARFLCRPEVAFLTLRKTRPRNR